MALLTEDSTCSLCGKRIDQAGPFFASTAVATNRASTSCNIRMRQSTGNVCFVGLVSRDSSVWWTPIIAASLFGNRYWTVLAVTDRYHVAQSAWVVDVSIAQTGMHWQIDVKKWPNGLQLKLTDGSLDVLPQSRRALAEQTINELLTSVPAI